VRFGESLLDVEWDETGVGLSLKQHTPNDLKHPSILSLRLRIVATSRLAQAIYFTLRSFWPLCLRNSR
jgi:hypothetical protein